MFPVRFIKLINYITYHTLYHQTNQKAATEAREIQTDYANALTKAGEVDSLKSLIETKVHIFIKT